MNLSDIGVSLGMLLAVVTFLITVSIGGEVIRLLIANRIGKSIRAEGPQSHLGKQGTPTMGGVIFLLPLLLVGLLLLAVGPATTVIPLAALLGFGVLGAADDYLSLVGRSKGGLRARTKMLFLLLIGGGAALAMQQWMGLDAVRIPLVGTFSLGVWFLPAAILVYAASTNAVNLTDGVDGLASGTAALAFVAYAAIANG
ncbi:MAG: phospho-N-acetylmuramoyl-pentapeptide-transferase, partial [Chloroflexi bacterium]|nr:phospho-N-acetylmuramoyl-pentapeptide-transferase [Chloroflexota bacterium]